MPISQITPNVTGLVGVNPHWNYVVCNDTLSEITTTGYLQGEQAQGYQFSPTDFFLFMYGANSNTGGIFVPSFSGSNITLSAYIPPGTVVITGATTDNNLPEFDTTTGGLVDSGIAAAVVSTYTGATVSGHAAKFNNTTGQLIDSGVPFASLQLAANIKINTVAYAGGSATFNVTVAGLTASSVAVCGFKSQANPASILTQTCGTNMISIVASADPGASVISFTAAVVAQ